MTELETQLLNSVTLYQAEQERQQKELESTYTELEKMFKITSEENHQLKQQVQSLALQVESLNSLLKKLS